MGEEVEKALEEICPSLQADGGDVEIIDVSTDGVVKVRLTGVEDKKSLNKLFWRRYTISDSFGKTDLL